MAGVLALTITAPLAKKVTNNKTLERTMAEAALATKTVLDPAHAEHWPDLGFEALYAMSWRD